jgi:hypothetical protein
VAIGIVLLVGVLVIAVVVLPNNPATPAQLQAVLDSLEVYPEGGPTLASFEVGSPQAIQPSNPHLGTAV